MEFFLGEFERLLSDERASQSALAGEERDGYIRLYNKNAGETYYAKIVRRCDDRFGWIVEMDDAPRYFSSVLQAATR